MHQEEGHLHNVLVHVNVNVNTHYILLIAVD